jgi:hypothetical protein
MRNVQKLASLIVIPVVGLSLLAGCDHTVREDKTTTTRSDGTKVTTQDKVTRNSDGTVTRTVKKDVDR